ncbi:hypothetical protein phytr_9710 [Candidatus Phycorickettsia trachydisci]|uniref:Uncharacterized protein n=1 Tax=Candidatus Phycorickettsia trachydisci TaxID=2115978 RepID=A0A2P1P9F5_9RICK|nr:hypothetical protein [Candidatus Phycorickettsia trachydisci]AVP87899.1 hypothetical protein phytr_9710 [Candidatus Phycorickettsia trachydisci]
MFSQIATDILSSSVLHDQMRLFLLTNGLNTFSTKHSLLDQFTKYSNYSYLSSFLMNSSLEVFSTFIKIFVGPDSREKINILKSAIQYSIWVHEAFKDLNQHHHLTGVLTEKVKEEYKEEIIKNMKSTLKEEFKEGFKEILKESLQEALNEVDKNKIESLEENSVNESEFTDLDVTENNTELLVAGDTLTGATLSPVTDLTDIAA